MKRVEYNEIEIMQKMGNDGVDLIVLLRDVNKLAPAEKPSCKAFGASLGYSQHQMARYCKILDEKMGIDLVSILRGGRVGRGGGRKAVEKPVMEIVPPSVGLCEVKSVKNEAIDRAVEALDRLREALVAMLEVI